MHGIGSPTYTSGVTGNRAVSSVESSVTARPASTVDFGAAASVRLSPQARELAARAAEAEQEPALPNADASKPDAEQPHEVQEELRQLKARDREVRTHEQAHKAAGGGHAGSIQLDFETGPDGKRYAVSGEVPIDVSAVKGDPDKTLQKMATVQRAALAPANPSGADRAVAARAAATASQARAERSTGSQSESEPTGVVGPSSQARDLPQAAARVGLRPPA